MAPKRKVETVWVKVNEKSPKQCLLAPSSGKLDVSKEGLQPGAVAINGVHYAFTQKLQTIVPLKQLDLAADANGALDTSPILITGPLRVEEAYAPDADEEEAEKVRDPLRLYSAAVKRLERRSGGTTTTAGTVVFVSAQGHFVTCLHSVLRTQGKIFPDTFSVEGRSVEHVVSFPAIDMSVWRVTGPGPAEHPYLPLGIGLFAGMPFMLVHYPLLVDQEGQQDFAKPTVTSGVISAVSNGTQVLGDAESFPNSSGGAACADGQVIAINTCGLSHEDVPLSQEDEEEDFSSLTYDEAWVGPNHERLFSGEESSCDPKDESSSQPLSPKTLTRKMKRAEANAPHKGTLCGMVPCSLLQPMLAKYKVLKMPQITNLRASKHCFTSTHNLPGRNVTLRGISLNFRGPDLGQDLFILYKSVKLTQKADSQWGDRNYLSTSTLREQLTYQNWQAGHSSTPTSSATTTVHVAVHVPNLLLDETSQGEMAGTLLASTYTVIHQAVLRSCEESLLPVAAASYQHLLAQQGPHRRKSFNRGELFHAGGRSVLVGASAVLHQLGNSDRLSSPGRMFRMSPSGGLANQAGDPERVPERGSPKRRASTAALRTGGSDGRCEQLRTVFSVFRAERGGMVCVVGVSQP
ncbi:hypothetical protein KFL_002680150 [Klebsormidium nitens]|uniref:Uncharacterized protein n=1 Tax=Klebsormidium nitens TaxID=105231 RepID=A0A1Y1I9G6_KLENI|nr:hypothetical protein KFL_002680150 [Klebsormidium nitens]|eukprot:GAQ86069.1 hypothetical protein KFL_002680150 [Klebsormidium nitens]